MYKEKLRVRSYGVPTGDDKVFVELKKKYDGVVYKRRVAMTAARRFSKAGRLIFSNRSERRKTPAPLLLRLHDFCLKIGDPEEERP